MPRRTAALWAVLVLALTGCASTPVSPVAAGFAPDPDTVVSRPATSSSPYSDFGRLGAGSDLVVAGEFTRMVAGPDDSQGLAPELWEFRVDRTLGTERASGSLSVSVLRTGTPHLEPLGPGYRAVVFLTGSDTAGNTWSVLGSDEGIVPVRGNGRLLPMTPAQKEAFRQVRTVAKVREALTTAK